MSSEPLVVLRIKPISINPKGLFGGLCNELLVDATGLVEAINRDWDCEPIDDVNDVEEWRRGGSETYVCVAELIRKREITRVIGKAFVGWGLPPADQQARWEERRQALCNSGIPVPKLFATYPGLCIEQYIATALGALADLNRSHIDQLGRIIGILLRQGYNPVNPLSDIRLDNDILYYVDFGSDLGGAGSGAVSDVSGSMVERVRASLRPDQIDQFESGLKASRQTN